MKPPRYLKLLLEGGIGDCIKVITCNYALRSLYEKHGTEVFVSYGGENSNDCGWGELLKKEVFDIVPGLSCVSPKEADALSFPTVKSFFDKGACPLNLNRLLPLNYPTPETEPPKDKRNIGIQLSSNDPRKTYSLKSWNKLIELILDKHQHTNIYLFDSPDKREEVERKIIKHKNVFNTVGNNLSSSICLISQMDLFISSDSFSKYICLCGRVPAILLCADVKFMTPTDLLKDCFLKEIVYNDNFKLLGAEYEDNFKVKSMVSNINEIKTEEILSHV